MLEQLYALIADELSVSKQNLTLETHIQDDLGADSLDALELIMSIENKFNVVVPEQEANKLSTIGDILRFIEANQ